jgi:hypothetical protein
MYIIAKQDGRQRRMKQAYTVPKTMDDFIVNNVKEKAFILWNEKFHSIG